MAKSRRQRRAQRPSSDEQDIQTRRGAAMSTQSSSGLSRVEVPLSKLEVSFAEHGDDRLNTVFPSDRPLTYPELLQCLWEYIEKNHLNRLGDVPFPAKTDKAPA